MSNEDNPPTESQRLDKWLWAARFFKTRSLAAEAVSGGKVQVDGQRVKPARSIRYGSEIRIRKGSFEITVVVQRLARQRRPAKEAVQLYTETEASRKRREEAEERRFPLQVQSVRGAGRPTKRDRRQLTRLTGR